MNVLAELALELDGFLPRRQDLVQCRIANHVHSHAVLVAGELRNHLLVRLAGDCAARRTSLDKASPGAVKGWTIEHAFVVRKEQLERVRALGARLSVQAHLYVAAPVLSKYWGHDRAEHVTPVKTFMDAGFQLVGGTDSANMPVGKPSFS